jgi:hypothetical protein
MGSWEFNIQMWRVSSELMGVEYSALEGLQSAHGRSILNCGGCPMSSWDLNIQLRRVSNELMGVEYSTTKGVQ